ncbi:zinc finger, RING/FYVE/PHD-type containing protein [Tanacetum coccineum]
MHVFHNKCILAWLSKNNHTCPLCREVLRPSPDRVWVPLPQGFVPPSPLPNTPALRKLLKHENKTPTPLPNMRYGLSFRRQAEGTATVLSPIEMNYLKDFLSTAGYGDEECVRLLARACGPFSYCIKSCSSVLHL